MRRDQELEERFTKRMFAIVDTESEGSFDEAIVAIVPLPAGRGEDAEASRAEASAKYQRAFGTDYLTLVPIAVDATAWNTDSLVTVPESADSPFLFPSDALNEIGELLGLEENERGESGFFDPARVVEAVRLVIDPRRPSYGREKDPPKRHDRFCPAWQYDPCDCDYAARSGLALPTAASYHAGFRPWPTAALHPDQFLGGCGMINIIESADRWNGRPWGCER